MEKSDIPDRRCRWNVIVKKILSLIANGKLDTAPLITHFYPLRDISAAYDLFEHRMDHVMKVGIIPDDSCESGFFGVRK